MSKKDEELKFGEFFVEQLNQRYKLNYRAVSNTEIASDVDIHGIAENHETLNLQLKTGEPELKGFFGSRIKYGTGMVAIDGNIENALEQIIKDGERHYSNRKNLVFLITGSLLFDCDEAFAQYLSSKLMNSTFMGVYLVRFHAGINIRPPLKDYVVAIKNIFGNHGEIF